MTSIADFKDGLTKEILRVVRETSFLLQTQIVKDTPIDTGRAKASWRMNENEADESVEPPFQDVVNLSSGAFITKAAPGEQTLSADQALSVAEAQQQKISETATVIVISNALDYIEGLENGNSKQAPSGMVLKNTTKDQIEFFIDQAIADKSTN